MAGLVLVALALAVRLSWVALVPTKPVGDFAMYYESASHLLAHGALDPEFVYMPGYVFLLAAVQALGGEILAAKVVGAVLGGLGTAAVYGITLRLWDGRAALAAALLYALWPAGIAVSSVTGTDLPAGVIILAAIYCLVRWGGERSGRAGWVGALAFGAVMGLAAYVRAVALPLTVLAALYFLSCRLPGRVVLTRTALAVVAAGLLLAPWVVRNRATYGEWFATDSHGGLTALVGANPNSDGAYSRSLNLLFHQVTGYKLLAPPHRAADRAAYELALDWTRFSPAYALGLVVLKAERLLNQERGLLYWPVYRAGVLRDSHRAWFDARRREIEAVVDVFWGLLVAAAVAGVAVAAVRRRWPALTLVPFALALVGIYALFFAEVRYHLPIALLLFPSAGGAVSWLMESVTGAAREGRWPRGLTIEALVGAAAVVGVFVGWTLLLSAGARLRDQHRFAVHVCRVGGEIRACKWRAAEIGGGRPARDSGLRGVFDGVGLALPVAGSARAVTELAMNPGKYRVQAAIDLAPPLADEPVQGAVTIATATAASPGRPPAAALAGVGISEVVAASGQGREVKIEGIVDHPGGTLWLTLAVNAAAAAPLRSRVWLTDLSLTPVAP